MTKSQDLKDLEAFIMGVIAQNPNCSPYLVHKTFLQSPSLFFSGSAGAIYPAIGRLEHRGLVKSSKSGTRGKPSRNLTITDAGFNEFLDWFYAPERAGDPGFDPLRGRISLLKAIPPGKRREAVLKLIRISKSRLKGLDPGIGQKEAGEGMNLALEIERATLKAKIKVLQRSLRKNS